MHMRSTLGLIPIRFLSKFRPMHLDHSILLPTSGILKTHLFHKRHFLSSKNNIVLQYLEEEILLLCLKILLKNTPQYFHSMSRWVLLWVPPRGIIILLTALSPALDASLVHLDTANQVRRFWKSVVLPSYFVFTSYRQESSNKSLCFSSTHFEDCCGRILPLWVCHPRTT